MCSAWALLPCDFVQEEFLVKKHMQMWSSLCMCMFSFSLGLLFYPSCCPVPIRNFLIHFTQFYSCVPCIVFFFPSFSVFLSFLSFPFLFLLLPGISLILSFLLSFFFHQVYNTNQSQNLLTFSTAWNLSSITPLLNFDNKHYLPGLLYKWRIVTILNGSF